MEGTCVNCGFLLAAGDTYCGNCGQPAPAVAAAPASAGWLNWGAPTPQAAGRRRR